MEQQERPLKNSKYVTSWWVELMPNGIYHVMFNLTDRWISYHAYNDEEYIFGDDDEPELGESHEDWEKRIQEVPKFLPENRDGVTYICTSHQNKDQVSFYYIPYQHDWVRKDKILFSGKNELEAGKTK